MNVIFIAGMVSGTEVVRECLLDQVRGLVGVQGGQAIET
jgi:hypothetical protein